MSTIDASGTTQTVYLRQLGSTVQYSTDNALWSLIAWPATVVNSDQAAPLKVLFTTTLTLTTSNSYFICGSSQIQFGSQTLNEDGTKPILDVSSVSAYPGVFKNGTSGSNGYSDISIYNLTVNSTGSALTVGGGWVAQSYFAKGASNNYIVNCNSNGNVTVASAGGIVGDQAGYAGSLYITYCSNSGSIIVSGGIVGASAGSNGGVVAVDQCFTSGAISNSAGGIVGVNAGTTSGTVTVTNCYSTGAMNSSAGGIIGAGAGIGDGGVIVANCYSTGTIGTSAGGIYGANAGSPSGSITATNCYSTGAIDTNAGGIFGQNFDVTTAVANHCYTSGSSSTSGGIYSGEGTDNPYGSYNYSEANNGSSGWNTVNANTALTSVPTTTAVGDTWTGLGINTPYELTNMGYSPYTTANISAGTALTRTFSQTITAGTATPAALVTAGHTFSLLVAPATVIIDPSSGAITATLATPAGTYTLSVRDSVNPYSITTYLLTVLGIPPTPTGAPTANCCAPVTRSSDYSFGWMYNVQEGNTSITEQAKTQAIRFTSYDAYMRYVMSLGTRR